MNRLIKIATIISLAILILIIPLCTKQQHSYSLISTKWEVSSITAPYRIYILIAPTPYPIMFMNDSSFTARLDVNICEGKYCLEGKNNIKINTISCTKVDGDSEFADTLINIFSNIQSYKIIGDKLELIAPNRIINLEKGLDNSN